MKRLMQIFLIGVLVIFFGGLLLGRVLPPSKLAETPEEYRMSSENAIVNCAQAYHVPQNTTEPAARQSLVACVETMRKLGY
jgi:hypothetical protein